MSNDLDLVYVQTTSCWDSGDGDMVDILELKDGRLLAISELEVALYDGFDDLMSTKQQLDRPYIPL